MKKPCNSELVSQWLNHSALDILCLALAMITLWLMQLLGRS